MASGQEYLADRRAQVDRLVASVQARREVIDASLNKSFPDWHWTIGQIFEHVHLGLAVYVRGMEAMTDLPDTRWNGRIRHGFIGGLLIRNMHRPGIQAPKSIRPASKFYDSSVVDLFLSDHKWLCGMIDAYDGRDLNRLTMSNPFFPLFKMTPADAVGVLAEHAERHIGQVHGLLAKT